MRKQFTLEYWIDDGWYVGKLKEVPGVFTQGETLEELEENIKEVYLLMMEEDDLLPSREVFEKVGFFNKTVQRTRYRSPLTSSVEPVEKVQKL